jgi:hypothetical protein
MKKYVSAIMVTGVVAGTVFIVSDAFAAGAGEDQIFGIVDRVLDTAANFLERIFQSLADAIRSVFTGSDSAKK